MKKPSTQPELVLGSGYSFKQRKGSFQKHINITNINQGFRSPLNPTRN